MSVDDADDDDSDDDDSDDDDRFDNDPNVKFLEDDGSLNLEADLVQWAVDFKVSHTVLTGLLSTLRRHGLSTLPKDGRTLLQSPQNVAKLIQIVKPGHYVSVVKIILFVIN